MVVFAEEAQQRFGDLNQIDNPLLKVVLLLQNLKRYRGLEVVKSLGRSTCTVHFQFHVIMDLHEIRESMTKGVPNSKLFHVR